MKILFFGRLRELLDCSEITLTQSGVTNVSELRQHLANKGGQWQEFIFSEHALVAINQMMALENDVIADDDEIAFFPPVTGG